MDDVAIIVLAAGKGTRMKSDLAKVLHPIAGNSMVNRVVDAAKRVASNHIHVVVGHQAETVKAEIARFHDVNFAFQNQLLGTGDAVKAAIPGINKSVGCILVLCGDVPLIQEKTIRDLVEIHIDSQSKITVLAVEMDDPKGYGRIIRDADGGLVAIREEADASDSEKTIATVNSGIYCFDRYFLEAGIQLIGNNNNQDEYYLTDLVEIAVSKGVKTRVITTKNYSQVMGVNTLEQLAQAERVFIERQT